MLTKLGLASMRGGSCSSSLTACSHPRARHTGSVLRTASYDASGLITETLVNITRIVQSYRFALAPVALLADATGS